MLPVDGSPRIVRRRSAVGLALIVTVAAGIASRTLALPGPFEEHAGDALYAVACYWAWAFAWPTLGRKRLGRVALGALAWGTAAAVELTQLVHTPWLEELRAGPMRWVLGQGYQHADLVAYAIGAFLAAGLDRLFDRPESSPGA